MGNSLKHCLGCILPCGALDLIRVVHLNGLVQEFSPPLAAAEILQANPGHVLTTPSSDDHRLVRRVNILSPESHLRRGGIYFLIPADHSDHRTKPAKKQSSAVSSGGVFPESDDLSHRLEDVIVLKKDKPSRRDRRRSRSYGGAWQPHLHSISED
ncbi:hypothetical protein IC582_027574 [Cucumis melo]|uniref:Uncharacterized protein LOC127144381 n=2 Tax=Cucumis melo TaxID=3656 RepID=A0A9I9DL51_CUCME|nr:uncharacterized protein LOC127144381 [Cucumis melo]KAA0036509.1 uncharacterized protein E6C27_scaffold6629G00010 [Cucumis melo var. makuwa]